MIVCNQVETIADVLMVVSGAPTRTHMHACNVADLALDMMEAIQNIDDPSGHSPHIRIRIGMAFNPEYSSTLNSMFLIKCI